MNESPSCDAKVAQMDKKFPEFCTISKPLKSIPIRLALILCVRARARTHTHTHARTRTQTQN